MEIKALSKNRYLVTINGKEKNIGKKTLDFITAYKTPVELANAFGFIVSSKNDEKRLKNAWLYYVTCFKGDGVKGVITEIFTRSINSKLINTAGQGENDNFAKSFNSKTFKQNTNATIEIKTGCGKFDVNNTSNNRYIAYGIDGSEKLVVFHYDFFIRMITTNFNGKLIGYNISHNCIYPSAKLKAIINDAEAIIFDRMAAINEPLLDIFESRIAKAYGIN